MIHAERYHDFSAGHRVVGHEGKCALLHGHNYRAHFKIRTEVGLGLDTVGRVIDFGTIKSTLCQWLEDNWDHRFLAWGHDPVMLALRSTTTEASGLIMQTSIVWVPFNPTAENMANYLLRVIGPKILPVEVELYEVFIEETRKCGVGAAL